MICEKQLFCKTITCSMGWIPQCGINPEHHFRLISWHFSLVLHPIHQRRTYSRVIKIFLATHCSHGKLECKSCNIYWQLIKYSTAVQKMYFLCLKIM